ncbi:hypothetical protein, partial [Streptomyces rubiginosohelvolus]|uniref:hypothetical protein n=1 Tax=Streptomyces rubiginosohelvolus TaxID=67362 RepID=UPI0035D8E06B
YYFTNVSDDIRGLYTARPGGLAGTELHQPLTGGQADDRQATVHGRPLPGRLGSEPPCELRSGE